MCRRNQEVALKVKNKLPNSSIGLSGIVYREDINVDSKHIEVNEMVKLMAEDNNIIYIDNSVIDASALNGSKLHLNAKGSSLLAVQFIKFLRSGVSQNSRRLFGSESYFLNSISFKWRLSFWLENQCKQNVQKIAFRARKVFGSFEKRTPGSDKHNQTRKGF